MLAIQQLAGWWVWRVILVILFIVLGASGMLPELDDLAVIGALELRIVERELGVHVVAGIPRRGVAAFVGPARQLVLLVLALHHSHVRVLALS